MKSHQEPRSGSSCAACKLLKRRCTPTCQFAPYFRSDEQNKFAKVHKVFGASKVSKILNEVPEEQREEAVHKVFGASKVSKSLNEVPEEQREEAVNTLGYEADMRLSDPVYGCFGAIASLQKKMVELQHDLILARARLAYYVDQTVLFSDDGANMYCPGIDMVEAFSGQDCLSFDPQRQEKTNYVAASYYHTVANKTTTITTLDPIKSTIKPQSPSSPLNPSKKSTTIPSEVKQARSNQTTNRRHWMNTSNCQPGRRRRERKGLGSRRAAENATDSGSHCAVSSVADCEGLSLLGWGDGDYKGEENKVKRKTTASQIEQENRKKV
ncbi:unnamed protein product [Fraxinus pennsylvanica]|uniref:LOB domain-containing protein n=1 Tax=Fraxinus pennsylvanica TaxID=56036 RepID=A0AAD2DY26_9LAMI|nr:unnamed protein product [Fraxinus pennsylvanica]